VPPGRPNLVFDQIEVVEQPFPGRRNPAVRRELGGASICVPPNPIESTFATVRLRTAKTRGCDSRTTIGTIVFKFGQSAGKGWLRLRGFHRLPEVMREGKFVDGVEEKVVS
jgi:hypothetical protein